jgi:hypothetical protein
MDNISNQNGSNNLNEEQRLENVDESGIDVKENIENKHKNPNSSQFSPKFPSGCNIPKEESWGDWFLKNNPLYLISVLLMFIGLYLINSEAAKGTVDVGSVIVYFGIQNLYELAMVAMAIYLLVTKTQPSHGKLLLGFVLLFLADLTFFQVRISVMSFWAGNIASGIYFVLGLIKIAAVIKYLNLRIDWPRIIYVVSAFSMIWFAPKYVYFAIDNAGGIVGKTVSAFSGHFELFLISFVAGLIHLPLIIQNWKQSSFQRVVNNELVGDETNFWRYWLTFCFAILPVQLLLNAGADITTAASTKLALMQNFLLWAVFAVFFAQALWRDEVDLNFGLNKYDSVALSIILVLGILSEKTGSYCGYTLMVNRTYICIALLATGITRKNYWNIGALLCAYGVWLYEPVMNACTNMFDATKKLSKTFWAAILVVGSFFLLGGGFALSISSKRKK